MTEFSLAGAAVGAALGLVAGSFAATLVLRWGVGASIVRGRSRCDSCTAPLGVRELVPLFSYAFQRGRCRRCGAAIPALHPVTEAMTAFAGALALGLAPDADGVAGLVLLTMLLALAVLDLRHRWLPDALTLPLLGLGLAAAGLGDPPLTDRVIGAALGFGSLWLIAFAYRHLRGRDGLGGGDPKLLGAIGAWLGWAALPGVVLVAAAGGLLAVAAMRLSGRAVAATEPLPLGTMLAAAAAGAWLAARL